MTYFVIIETTAVEGVSVHNVLGYTTDKNYAESLCVGCVDMCNWIEGNIEALESGEKNMGDYFDVNENVCQIGWETDCIEGQGLIELTE